MATSGGDKAGTRRTKAAPPAGGEDIAGWEARVIDASPDAVLAVDLNGTILAFNRAAERLFACTAEEAIGTHFERFVPARTRPRHPRLFAQFLDSGVADADMAARDPITAVRADGKAIRVQISLIRCDLPGGAAVACVIRDTAERVRAQVAVTEAQKRESLRMVAAGVAHDLSNVLSVILGNIAVLRNPATEAALKEQTMEDIEVAANRAALLVGHMRDYAGGQTSLMTPADLNGIVADTAGFLRVSMPPNIVLNFRPTDEPLIVECNAVQIQQVAMNLVLNAREAIDGKKGVIAVRTGVARLDRHALTELHRSPGVRPGEFAFIEIEDNGPGIDPETLDKVFDPYYTTKTAGRGLGLASVSGIVGAHRGAIGVTSRPGVGTHFRVYLRLAGGAARSAHPGHGRRAAGASGAAGP